MALVAQKVATSPIWQFFGFRPDESRQGTRLKLCKICSCVIRTKDQKMTNLHDHLCVRHAEVNIN